MDRLIGLGMGIPYPYPTHGHPTHDSLNCATLSKSLDELVLIGQVM